MTAPALVAAPPARPLPWRGWLGDVLALARLLARVRWSAETWVAVGALGLPALLLVRLLPHVGWTGWAGLRAGLVALGVMAVAGLAVSAGGGGGARAVAGRTCGPPRAMRPRVGGMGDDAACGCGGTHTAHGWGGKSSLVRHERDGHGRAVRKAGAGGFTWEVWKVPGGGWSGVTHYRSPRRVAKLPPEKRIAILRAGVAAAPGTTSPTDGPRAAEILRRVPAKDRGRVDREADRLVKEWIR